VTPSTDAQVSRLRVSLLVLVLALLALPALSSLLGLYDRVEHWSKLVHGLEVAGATALFGLLLLGWRDREAVEMSDPLAGLLTVFAGVLFGVIWDFVEFLLDWTLLTALQTSNADTMTDLLWSDVGAVVAALLAVRIYCHVLATSQREYLGGVAAYLVDGPNRILDRHGRLVTFAAAALGALAAVSLWLAERYMS
jgi:hypothetical protein